MKGTTYNIELAVVSSGQSARAWQQLLERELARTGNLSGSPMRADALVVIIDPSFPDLIWRAARCKDACSEAIREALATGKMLLPVSVGNAVIPEDSLLPEGIRALTRFQGLALGRESDLPGVAARLVVAARTMAHPYVPAKTESRRVFISYRREDSWYWAGLLAAALARRLAAHNVFFDLGSIAPGRNFDAEIQSRIHDATVFIIIVGPEFMVADQSGRRRLDAPGDFVRREIITAIEDRKLIHIVLAGDAALPDQKPLPGAIAPAFEGAEPLHLANHRASDSVAEKILSRHALAGSLHSPKQWLRVPSFTPGRFQTPKQKVERFIMAAVPPLAALGWQPVDLTRTNGALVMIRSGDEAYRFVFDFENSELVLEERARGLGGWGLKRWIKRSIFPISPDAPDIEALRPPDRQVEAMENPGAHLGRMGRVDLSRSPQPPMRSEQVYRYLREYNQPARRALDQQAHEHARIRSRGGLRVLACVHRISLGEDVIARAVAVNPSTGRITVASSHGAYAIDSLSGAAEHIGLRSDLKQVGCSSGGMLAAHDWYRLSVLDRDGRPIVRRRTPYSTWQRIADTHGTFKTLSWSADETRIAIGASDRIWIYNLGSDQFEQVALQQDGRITSAAALFVPDSDDLLIMHFHKLWRVSRQTGEIGLQLDMAAGSDCYDPYPGPDSGGTAAGVNPDCLALSADGKRLAIGGNDAQLVLVDAETLQPTAMRVWHTPLVDGWINGKVEALAFSPDGGRLASVANDNRLVVGDPQTGDCLADGLLSRETGRRGRLLERDVCWSVDGAQVAVVNGEGRIELWNTDASTAKSRAG